MKTKNNKRPTNPKRSAKIDALKGQIEQGTYRIDPERVAQAMIDDLTRLRNIQ
ncbi:MAG: hypothetical protein GWP10_01750 [Nitrospiraceae bacterium]|nr:hypothetical protein [Nitrospiraceae bacterium]